MSSSSNPLKFVFPLKHIASVKTIELLWNHSGCTEPIKTFYKNEDLRFCPTPLPTEPTINALEKSISNLPIPSSLKHHLKVYISEMTWDALFWIHQTIEDLNLLQNHKLNESTMTKLLYFIDNLSWSNSGLINGKEILKSYVKNKETTDFDTWRQLCHYCIEDEILRLSKTINWKKVTKLTDNSYYIYWYLKINGKFPKKNLFSSKVDYYGFKEDRKNGKYDEINININLLMYSAAFRSNIAAVKYFRSQIKNFEEFETYFEESWDWIGFREESAMYLIREMRDDFSLNFAQTSTDLFSYFLQWPWVLFIDLWIKVFENVEASVFLGVFRGFYRVCGSKFEGFKNRRDEGIYDPTFYEPFRKLWRVFYERFGGDDQLVAEGFSNVFKKRDLVICRDLLESLRGNQRIFVLRCLAKKYQKPPECDLKNDFLREFVENGLERDQEKDIFEGVPGVNR